jgi:hypothetical protein
LEGINRPPAAESCVRVRWSGCRVETAPGAEPLLEAAGLATIADALNPDIGTPVAGSRSSWVRRVPAGATALYVKCFVYPTARDALLRIVSRRLVWHRARREWRSLGLQEALGLPAIRRVCLAEFRRLGLLRAAVLATEELAGAQALDVLLREGRAAAGPMALADAAGRHVARLHAAGFVHGDLNARNVLVRDGSDGALDLRSIDSARGRRRRWAGAPARAHLGDLAPLVLAFTILAGANAADRVVASYAAGVGIGRSAVQAHRLGQAVGRIAARESARLGARDPAP